MALLPPKSLDEWRDALMGWNGFALSMHSAAPLDPTTGRPASGELSAAERDLRIQAGLQMLGDPMNAVDKKLTVSVCDMIVYTALVRRNCRLLIHFTVLGTSWKCSNQT
jgi:hypothetical protein